MITNKAIYIGWEGIILQLLDLGLQTMVNQIIDTPPQQVQI